MTSGGGGLIQPPPVDASGASMCPLTWIPLSCLLVDNRALTADLRSISVVVLVRSHKLDAAVAVLVVVSVHKRRHPLVGGLLAGEWSAGVIGPVFRCTEQRFRVRAVVRHSRSGEGSEYSQFLQVALERGGMQLFEEPAARHCRYLHGGSTVAGVLYWSAHAGTPCSPDRGKSRFCGPWWGDRRCPSSTPDSGLPHAVSVLGAAPVVAMPDRGDGLVHRRATPGRSYPPN